MLVICNELTTILEKLIVAELFNKFLAFYLTQRFSAVFTIGHQWTLF